MSGHVPIRRPHPHELALLGLIEEEADKRYSETQFPELAHTLGLPADVAGRLAGEGRLVVAEAGGTIAGFVAWCREEDPTVLGVSQISVLTRFGRAGIGTRLIDHVVDVARTNGFRAIALNTQVDVPWNAPWYERMGFVVVEPASWTDWMKTCAVEQQTDGVSWNQRVWMLLELSESVREHRRS